MVIEKSNFKVSRFESEFSTRNRETMYSDEEEIQPHSSVGKSEEDDDDEFDDADSGAGSDDIDLLDLGEPGAEFCQIENETCRIPLDLYDLPGLEGILSVDVWNEVLTEEERLGLAKYLPDMDHETFVVTLKELFSGLNFHFGSPVKKFFDMLKGGLCERRVALYRQGLCFLQKRQHYHLLQKHQNDMVAYLCQIRDAWLNCRGYSIEEKLRVLNIMQSQHNLMYEKMDNLGSDSSEKASGKVFWSSKSKDNKAAQKRVCRSMQEYEFYPREESAVMETEKYGKQKPKSILKLTGSKPHSTKNKARNLPSPYLGLNVNSRINDSMPFVPLSDKGGVYDEGEWLKSRDHIKMRKDVEESTYGMGFQQDHDISHVNLMDSSGRFRRRKRHGHLNLDDEIASDSFLGVQPMLGADFHGYVRDSDQSLDIKMSSSKPSGKASFDYKKKVKQPENVQQYVTREKVKSAKSRVPHLPMRGNIIDSSSHGEPFWHHQSWGDDFSRNSTFKSDEWTLKSKKWQSGIDSPDLGYKNYRSASPQVTERYLHSDFRTKSSKNVSRGVYVHSGGSDMVSLKGNQVHRSEGVESDSSEHLDDDEDINSFLRSKSAHPHRIGGSCHSKPKSHPDPKMVKSINRKRKEFDYLDELHDTKKTGRFEKHNHLVSSENYQPNSKTKGKVQIDSSSCNPACAVEDDYFLDKLGNFDDTNQIYKFSTNGRTRGESIEMLYEGKRKSRTGHNHPNPGSHYWSNYDGEEEDDLLAPKLLEGIGIVHDKFVDNIDEYDSPMNDQLERSEASLLGCNSVLKKRKGKEEENGILQSNLSIKLDDSSSMKRKGKKKQAPDREGSELPSAGIRTADMDLDKKLKKSFTSITPTVHTGFSFSIIHLLSAVRTAMIMPLPADASNVGIPKDSQGKEHKDDVNGVHSDDKVDSSDGHTVGSDIPFLPIQEIVNRVRSNPGDPCILETQEPLQDLIRGVMKIFSSKSAPLGAKGWKVLAIYEKSTKSWSWVGPVVHNHSDHATYEGVISPEAWGLPHKMLVKLVDAFANWLKSGQDTLQQIGSLPLPPLSLMQVNLDEKERFKDLRAQKSLNTISRSSEEVRDYFRREEILRYSIPDRAFSYTAADGKKSIVAPLRRCGGKPTSKARDHFMLKRDRPPHVTILCLVRDAAARLPGRIGTRADVCTLIRDSQYIVEDVSDVQINQVVSGALDRLHYERDPCVQYDGERKLWVYLHRDREEEDFEDDGTSSTKKWKRQKKDTAEHSDQGAVTFAYHGRRDQSCPDVCSDLNVEPLSMEDDNTAVEPVANDVKLNMEDNIDDIHESEEVDEGHGSTIWDSLGRESVQKDKLLCLENSTNEEFDDESFGREGAIGLLNATLLS